MFNRSANNEVKANKIFIILLLIILFPFLLFTLPFYFIYTKINFENIYKLLLSTLLTSVYFAIFLVVAGYYGFKPIKITSPNLYIFNSEPQQLLDPKSLATPSTKKEYVGEGFFVTRVIDGDTIELSDGAKVRYIGINAPEVTKNRECFGEKAKQKNTDLVLNKKVRLEKDVSNKDKYERLLRYVYVDKNFINKTLVEQGFANAATYPPDVKYKDLFVTVQKQAQQKNVGLWKDCRR